jgi:hypothetical protein
VAKALCISAAVNAASGHVAGQDPGSSAIDVGRELWIRDLSVVEDGLRTRWTERPASPSEGVWSFGRLMSAISGLADPAPFVLALFDHFRTLQVVNGMEIPPQLPFYNQTILPWVQESERRGRALDFSIAPFRLNGFVNRIDLRTNTAHGRSTTAGEGRIVFTILLPDGSPSFTTLILEYELLARDGQGVKEWAEAWHALGSIPFGERYNLALEKLVNRFAEPGAAPDRPNGSALLQLRTNEFARQRRGVLFGSTPWQWREFRLSPQTGAFTQVTTAQTVDTSHNGSALLADFINEHEASILDGTFVVPLTYQGVPFRSGAANGEPFFAFLDAPGVSNNEARHLLSLNSCVACHTSETGVLFFHSFPRPAGEETFLSGFLTGTSLPDPAEPTVTRTFNDLERRVLDLQHVLSSPAEALQRERPLGRVH